MKAIHWEIFRPQGRKALASGKASSIEQARELARAGAKKARVQIYRLVLNGEELAGKDAPAGAIAQAPCCEFEAYGSGEACDEPAIYFAPGDEEFPKKEYLCPKHAKGMLGLSLIYPRAFAPFTADDAEAFLDAAEFAKGQPPVILKRFFVLDPGTNHATEADVILDRTSITVVMYDGEEFSMRNLCGANAARAIRIWEPYFQIDRSSEELREKGFTALYDCMMRRA